MKGFSLHKLLAYLRRLALAAIVISFGGCQIQLDTESLSLESPDTSVEIDILVRGDKLGYQVHWNGQMIIPYSSLGLEIDDIKLGEKVRLGKVIYSEKNENYELLSTHAQLNDHCNISRIPVLHRSSGLRYTLELRAYNTGFAYRYLTEYEKKPKVHQIQREASSWVLPEARRIWYQDDPKTYTGIYRATEIDSLAAGAICALPATFELANNQGFLSIAEAQLSQYSGMALRHESAGRFSTYFHADSTGWEHRGQIITPWRVVMLGTDLNALYHNNLVYHLNPEPDSSLIDANWIQPGAVLSAHWESDSNAQEVVHRFIDLAQELLIPYVLLDGNWEAFPSYWRELDSLIAYAQIRGIDLWVKKSAIELADADQRYQFFLRLHRHKIAGIKIDHGPVESYQSISAFYDLLLKDAAKHELMVSFAQAPKPSGRTRTWPNEMSRSALRTHSSYFFAEDTEIPPTHDVIAPFTRQLVGATDYGPGLFRQQRSLPYTWTHELAQAIVFSSPMLYWADHPEQYLFHKASDFIQAIPSTWDESIVLSQSKIGELAAIARRKGDTWFLGILNDTSIKNITLPLNFLDRGNYQLRYFTSPQGHPNRLLRHEAIVDQDQTLPIRLDKAGGCIAIFSPTNRGVQQLKLEYANAQLDQPMQVRIKNIGQRGTIRYTRDGSPVTSNAKKYDKPFTIWRPTHLQVALFTRQERPYAHSEAFFYSSPAPKVEILDSIFLNQMVVEILEEPERGEIRYTLNGRTPTLKAKRYTEPFTIKKSVVLTAAFRNAEEKIYSEKTQISLTKIPLQAAQKLGKLRTGLAYKYYPEYIEKASAPEEPKPTKQWYTRTIYPGPNSSKDSVYTFFMEGYIKIPADSIYQFRLNAKEQSSVWINDKPTISYFPPEQGDEDREAHLSQPLGLAAGHHKIKVIYYHKGGEKKISLAIKPQRGRFKPISRAMLFRPR